MAFWLAQLDSSPVQGSPAAPEVDLPGLEAGAIDAAREAAAATQFSSSQVIHGYLFVFVIAFLATLLITPLVRRIAIRAGIVDWPDERKSHREPVAYLGGVAVFIGLMLGIVASYLFDGYKPGLAPAPWPIVVAMAVIMLTGLLDDVFHWDPYTKLGGQFFAAAALAADEHLGGRVAQGLLKPIESALQNMLNNPGLDLSSIQIVPGVLEIDIVYWAGAVIIAAFVVVGCNAANLIDGLDGLLSGSAAIMATALLAISVLLAVHSHGELTGARVVLCFALLGATLGFLPHNFRPATIFLGDAGSLLIGFTIVVIILLLGEQGRTHLVFAGLMVFAVPLIDTTLAILRRRLNGLPVFTPDNEHMHHMLKRTKLGTMGAVLVMYGISAVFALLAVLLVFMRARVVYALGLVFAGFIVVIGIKEARRKQRVAEMELIKSRGRVARGANGRGVIASELTPVRAEAAGADQQRGAGTTAPPHAPASAHGPSPAPSASRPSVASASSASPAAR